MFGSVTIVKDSSRDDDFGLILDDPWVAKSGLRVGFI
jgi:hypothetical protein